ncbi:TetR family transcriptional regulator [Sporichthya brevicatena]|uniref:TetR family transcriptional regulator n=1 Tax=Sporichthya brevicatena TaxID=171442 RepID=A0ABN1G982_9ACTN
MGRWEPDAKGRLCAAALELYSEHGFEATTVAQIAERVGVTERTFFRYFADKREVLFSGAEALEEVMVAALAATPASTPALDQVAAALRAASDYFPPRELSRSRHEVITANADLRERELIKLARLSGALTDALRRRGVKEPAAGLAAETGMAVFKVAFARWVTSRGRRTFADFVDEALAQLHDLAGTTGAGAASGAH